MEFGLFNGLYVPDVAARDNPDAEYDRLRDEIALVVAADRAGFKYTWATEHHFLREYSHLSANESFLAYLAGVTERIHLGSGIFNLTPPVNHPARIAERVAMIDLLSGGRFEFGVGRGSSTTEQRGFGIDDPELTREMVDEVLAELPLMWRDGEYEHAGRFFSMPPRHVLPKPYAKPHPPIWVAAGNPSTFQKAARLGIGVLCFSAVGPEMLAPLIELYKKEIQSAEPVGDFVNDNVMVTTQMLCLDDGDRARREFARMGTGYHQSLVFRYLDTFPKPPGLPVWPDLVPEPTVADLEDRVRSHLACVGDPGEVSETLRAYQAAGADQVVFGLLSSLVPIDLAVESVETFGRHVIPEFDVDPVHRTTRHREASLAGSGHAAHRQPRG
jgi:alkanesulfonate monooxygenase SsuD/methylene tetrahydromethanopterin reductase-like flavin-dependent oxidoreductase (luciferase family)